MCENVCQTPLSSFAAFFIIQLIQREQRNRESNASLIVACFDERKLCQLVCANGLALAVVVQHLNDSHYLRWYSLVSQGEL